MLFALNSATVFSQNHGGESEDFEKVYAYWLKGIEKCRETVGANSFDFLVFQRFYENKLDAERGRFLFETSKGKPDMAKAEKRMQAEEKIILGLYRQFEQVKKEFPSSVNEFKHPFHGVQSLCDSTGCTNIGFEQGTLNGWNAYYAYNNNQGGNNFFDITHLTGGPVGAVTLAANDTLTSTNGFYNPTINYNPRPDYQVVITHGPQSDALVSSMPEVSPFGGSYSVMLGDSTEVNYGAAILSKTFYVTAQNDNFTYQYAVLLENPQAHTYFQQPFFIAAVLDQNGDTIPHCGEYTVVSSGSLSGFHSIYYAPSADSVYYKNWTTVSVPLKKYIGTCVTVVFETGDCGKGGHFGYAYVDASCAPLGIITSSAAICKQGSVTLTAPSGFTQYKWSGPPDGITSKTDTTQSILVDSAGIYSVIVTPFTGASCADTLYITITKATPVTLHPSFTADSVCVGQPTSFTNTSNPISGKFYWDFYNQGTFQDSATNPTWTYNNEGVYFVRLYQMSGGCGVDTVLKIQVDSTPIAAFNATGGCLGLPTFFTNASKGAVAYSWNFGEPSSGAANVSTLVNPSHTYAKGGKYKVTLAATNSINSCVDTFRHAVDITPIIPTVSITGKDSICSGDSTTLKATGTNIVLYSWSTIPTVTLDSVTVLPSATTKYSITVSHGSCFVTDSITVSVLSAMASFKVTGGCVGQVTNFNNTSSGALTYSWNFGDPASGGSNTSNLTSPTHTYASVGTYTVSLIAKSAKGICVDSIGQVIIITSPPTVSVSGTRSICPGSVDSLTATGTNITSYSWSTNPVQTAQSAGVNPNVNTTYTVSVANNLCTITDTFKVNMLPTPTVTIKGRTTSCSGTNDTLTAISKAGNYVWSTGATTSSIIIPVNKDSTYYVVVKQGCTDTAYYTVNVIPGAGIKVCCDTTIAYGGTANLNASGDVTYAWQPSNSVNCNCSSVTVNPGENTTYTVIGTDVNGCLNFDTVTVDIECATYFVPNVFTPNNDGQNDNFLIKAYGYNSYHIEIYDRWGLLEYTSDTPFAPWDGKDMSGVMVSDGVYYYIIKSVCGTKETDHDGFVQVIR